MTCCCIFVPNGASGSSSSPKSLQRVASASAWPLALAGATCANQDRQKSLVMKP
jgi:hypothetical protein